jgi:protein phosphatase
MSQDHSAAMELVNRGMLSLHEADHHEDRNVILRAMGTHARIQPTTWSGPFPLRPGDYMVLCSDGLYEAVRDQEISSTCSEYGDPEAVCEGLVRIALEREVTDNLTVAVLHLGIAS